MKKFISLVLTLSLLMSTVNVAFPINTYAENENANAAVDNTDVWAIENSIDSVGNKTDDITETKESAGVYSMLQANPEDAYSISLMASFEFSSLTGKVVDEDGKGIKDVYVQIYNVDEDIRFTPMLTNENGEWNISGYDIISGYTYEIWYTKTCYMFSKTYIKCVAEDGGTIVEQVTGTHFDLPGYVCYEDDYTYTISNEKATITKYNGVAENILIPEKLGGYPVTAIGYEAFKNNKTVKGVYCSELITSIDSYAFYNCTNLTDIRMSNLFTTIGSSAFYGCTGLTEVTLPDSVTTISGSAFKYCSNLESINYPLSWKSAGEYIFDGCTKLTTINIPEGVTTIPYYAFYGATSIKNIELPSTLTTIDGYAFYRCTGLAEVTLPDSVTTINGRAFNGCSNLESINYPLSWKSAGEYIFGGCTKLTTINIPEGVTTIPYYAFYGATSIKNIELPSTLTTIDGYAFYGCTGLAEVTLPDNVTTIGSSTFSGCTGLTKVTLPNSITTINGRAFNGCSNLESINYPLSWKSASEYIFGGCTKLTTINIPEGVTTIPYYAFYGATSIKNIELPSTLTTIDGYAFYGCTGLAEVTLPDNVTTIGSSTFSGCTGLTKVTLPNSITTINGRAFNGCSNLESINYPLSWKSAGEYIFSGCTKLTTINVPEGVTSIPNYAFYGANCLREVFLPSSLTDIGYSAFSGCSSVVVFFLPDNVKKIGGRAFSGCSLLERIWIGESVEQIDDTAFSGSSKVVIHGIEGSYANTFADKKNIPFSTEVIIQNYDKNTITGKVVDSEGNGISDVYVKVFNSTLNKLENTLFTDESGKWSIDNRIYGTQYEIRYYKTCYEFSKNAMELIVGSGTTSAENVTGTHFDVPGYVCYEDDYTYTVSNEKATITKYNGVAENILIPEKLGGYPVTTIGYEAFKNNKTVKGVYCSELITSIDSYAFYNCTNLTDIRMSNLFTTIGSSAFYGCTGLTEVTLPDSVTTINSRAFYGCSNLESINYPLSWKSAGEYIFSGCTKFTTINVPEGVTTIPYDAFYGATSIKNIELPSTLTTIDGYAFYGCTGLTEVTLPDSVTTINGRAFYSCSNLESINYPLSWKSAGEYIFGGCTKLTTINIPEGVTTIPYYAFYGATSIKNIELPSTLTTIDGYAFYGCTGLAEVTLPDNVTTIGSSTFSGCTGLTKVTLPNSITTINGRAFNGCSNLESINYPLSWKSAGEYIFSGCTKLTTINVPEGVTSIPNYAFYGANCLREVFFPSTLVDIGYSAFSGCSKLRRVYTKYGIKSIGNSAFRNCAKLLALNLPESVESIGDYCFNGCDALSIYCSNTSKVSTYLIDNNIPINLFATDPNLLQNRILKQEDSYYIANTVSARANGYIAMNLAYEFKDEFKDSISDITLKIRIPSNSTLIEKTLMLDGVRIMGYEFTDNLLTIKLSKAFGKLSFDISPTSDNKLSSYALLTFKQGGTNKQEVIDVVNEDIPLISILANDEVDTADVAVNGVGPADTDIKLYVDGTLATTVHSNKTGGYSTKVTIPNPSNYASYTITAKATDDEGAEISASKNVVYSSGAPVIQSFTMNYENNTYDVLELGSTKPTVTFTAGSQFGFNVKFSNAEKVEDVYICSTRSNVTKRIKAEWNEATQSYTAKGLFDPSNTSYVPGTITVQYSQVKDKLSFANGIDYSSEKYVNGASDPIKSMLKGKVKDCVEDLVSTDNTLSGVIKMIDVDSQMDFNILTDVIPSWLDPSNAGEYGYEVMEDDYGAKLYLKVAEYGEDKVRGEILDFAKGKVTDFLIEGKYISAVEGIESYFSFVEVLGYADKFVTWDNNRIAINEARQSVLASSMSEAEKAQALQKLEFASKANGGTIACMALSIVLTAAGISLPFPFGLVLPLLSMQDSMYVKDVLGEFGFLGASETDGVMFNFRWKIDPSGYVYDAYTNERLQGVKTTAYWIEYDPNNATFWDNTPSDTEYGTLWDASEWDQINPLITDAEGRYSWDVPEGWWRVKYEKAGYETVWSHWMTVPPVQTDVNIGMTATEKPDKYITYNNSTKTVTVTSNVAYSNANIYIAAYQGGKLLSLKSQPKNIVIGETPVVFSDFDSTGADTVKVMVWESASNLKPLFNTCVVKLK